MGAFILQKNTIEDRILINGKADKEFKEIFTSVDTEVV